MEFKVGDRVRFSKEMDGESHGPVVEFDNIIRKIIEIKDGDIRLEGLPENWFYEIELELVDTSKFTKSDLQEGDIVTDRESNKSIFLDGELCGFTIDLDGLTDELKDDKNYSEYDIVKVERPIIVETVFERKEESEVREMTVEEISRVLGYEVKVVK